jgi:hypothetical protein
MIGSIMGLDVLRDKLRLLVDLRELKDLLVDFLLFIWNFADLRALNVV